MYKKKKYKPTNQLQQASCLVLPQRASAWVLIIMFCLASWTVTDSFYYDQGGYHKKGKLVGTMRKNINDIPAQPRTELSIYTFIPHCLQNGLGRYKMKVFVHVFVARSNDFFSWVQRGEFFLSLLIWSVITWWTALPCWPFCAYRQIN